MIFHITFYAPAGSLQRVRLYAPDGSVYAERPAVEAPAETFTVSYALPVAAPNSLIAYEVEAREVATQDTPGYTGSVIVTVARQPYAFALDGVWYDSAGEVEIITLLHGISEGSAAIAPESSGGAFDPVAAETSTFWTHIFTAIALDVTGWTKFVFTIKAFPDIEDDSEALLAVTLTNPAAGGTDGVKIHNRNVVDVGEAIRGKAAITVEDTDPNGQARVTLLPEALALPPSPDNLPYQFEINWWDSAGIKKPFGRGEFALRRAVLRGITAP